MANSHKNSNGLSLRERELTALGAAIASNCIPCIEYHIPQARKIGLSDADIREAVELAEKVRRVPADKVLQTAFALLEVQCEDRKEEGGNSCGCS
jgi:4-carboxymuconolactone decarboxylase